MQVTFYYDYGSPYSYIAWAKLPDLCACHGAMLDRRPILLGGIFKIVGTSSPAEIGAKRRWLFDDLRRQAEHDSVPFLENPYFIINTLPLMRGAMWAEIEGCLEAYDKAMFEACWADGRNMNDPAEIMTVLAEGGFDAEAVKDAIQTDEIKQRLIQATQDAVDRDVFGVPTMIVGDELHFGQDRLAWVERALAKAQTAR